MPVPSRFHCAFVLFLPVRLHLKSVRYVMTALCNAEKRHCGVSLVRVLTSGTERTFGPRTTAYLSVSISTFLLPLPGLRTLTSRSTPFPVMPCTCNKVYETRTWLRQITRASFAVETTSFSLALFWDRVDSAGLSRVVSCDAEPAIGWMQKSRGIRPGSTPWGHRLQSIMQEGAYAHMAAARQRPFGPCEHQPRASLSTA